jgi:hypothetical protein
MFEHTFSIEKLAWHIQFIPLFNMVSWKNRSAAQTPSTLNPFGKLRTGLEHGTLNFSILAQRS